MDYEELIGDLCESYVNGNPTYVWSKLEAMEQMNCACVCLDIYQMLIESNCEGMAKIFRKQLRNRLS